LIPTFAGMAVYAAATMLAVSDAMWMSRADDAVAFNA
jgi:hypothetical protein